MPIAKSYLQELSAEPLRPLTPFRTESASRTRPTTARAADGAITQRWPCSPPATPSWGVRVSVPLRRHRAGRRHLPVEADALRCRAPWQRRRPNVDVRLLQPPKHGEVQMVRFEDRSRVV